jgi:SAM-dependent methyltransferase
MEPGLTFDWGRISADYARYRAGPPPSYYARLKEAGVGLPGQRILDLGTGTGVLARTFARAGARVAGIDVFPGQIASAVQAAAAESLPIDFLVARAESTPFEPRSFDAITANQCWHFVDSGKALAEARRVIVPGGPLVVSDFFWLGRKDPIAAATEDLILKYCPTWSAYRWNGELPARPDAPVAQVIDYEEPISFTRESWRGRVRTCRVIGPSMPEAQVKAFDEELKLLVEAAAPDQFTVQHRVVAHIYRLG